MVPLLASHWETNTFWAVFFLMAAVSGLAGSFIQEKRGGKWLSGFWIGWGFGIFGLIYVSLRDVSRISKTVAAFREGQREGDLLP